MEAGHPIFVQSDDRRNDPCRSLRERAESEKFGLGKQAFVFSKNKKGQKGKRKAETETAGELASAPDELAQMQTTVGAACAKWLDVRAFGNLFAWKAGEGKADDDSADGSDEASGKGVSIPIRGPVSIHSAFSVEPVEVTSTQITKSVNSEGDGTKRGRDTMGMKHRVDKGVYVFYGSMNPQLAERTGFSEADAAAIKSILPKMFENDASSARPEGSMQVLKVVWWEHGCKAGQYSSAKVHRSLTVKPDGQFELATLEGLTPEVVDGF
jgi:CRISPR-associated protein Csd2